MYTEKPLHTASKVTFPNLPPAQGYASPSRKLVLLQIDHNYTIGVIYVYICIGCQSSILSHMVPELIICWNYKGCIGKSIGPVQYRFTIPSLLAQCHLAGSMPRCWLIFLTKKNEKKTNAKKLSQLHALGPARYAVIIPANTYYVFVFSFHIRSPAQRDVAGSIFSSCFFRSKN